MQITPHVPNANTAPETENKTSVRQLLDGQEYPVEECDIIKKGFDCEAAIERCVAYLHGLSQLPGCSRYTGDRITSCTCLQLLPIDNNNMLVAEQFLVDSLEMHFNTNKALYIHFQNHASIFYKEMLSTINGGWNV